MIAEEDLKERINLIMGDSFLYFSYDFFPFLIHFNLLLSITALGDIVIYFLSKHKIISPIRFLSATTSNVGNHLLGIKV